MSAFATVVQREIKDKKAVVWASAVFGLLPPLMLLAGKIRSQDTTELAAWGLVFVVASMFFGVALACGASMFSRELAERRMGFYFTRPMSSMTLWLGKSTAAIILPIVAAVVPIVISVILGVRGKELLRIRDQYFTEAATAVFGVMIFFLLLTNAAAIAIRARSSWLGLQLASFVIAVAIFAVATRPLVLGMAMDLLQAAVFTLISLFLISLLVSSYLGIARGRTEIVRVQRSAAISFAIAILSGALLFSLFSAWIVAVDRDDFRRVFAHGSNASSLVVMGGESHGRFDYEARFAYDVESGKELRMTGDTFVALSREGKRVVWGAPQGLYEFRHILAWADLSEAEPEVHETTIDLGNRWFTIDRTGERAIISDTKTFAVYHIKTEKQLAAFALPVKTENGIMRASFVGDDIVRLHVITASDIRGTGRTFGIFEYSIAEKKVTKVGELNGTLIRQTADEKQLLVIDRVANELRLADPRTGVTQVTVPIPATAYFGAASVVGSRIVVTGGEKRELSIYDRSGTLQRAVATPGEVHRVVPGPRPDTVIAAVGKDTTDAWLIELTTGKAMKVLDKTTSVASRGSYFDFIEPMPGAPVTKVFENLKSIFVYDFATGKKTVIAGRA